ncbi:glycosyltransferase family 9 protein [Pseudomonas cerasi]
MAASSRRLSNRLHREDRICLQLWSQSTAIEIVRISDIVVSTDTSIVHIANALNRSLIALHNKRKLKDTGMPGYKIWAPNFPPGKTNSRK